MSRTVENELRIGLRALEAGRIDPERLLEAVRIWAETPSTSLADHFGNEAGTLADASGPEESSSAPKSTLAAASEATVEQPSAAPSVEPPGGTPQAPRNRFRMLRPHAVGGLGAVHVALDTELNREVALKEILGHRADDAESRRRFIVEAEITGNLEHPGIVPVYGLGTHDGGRPYYAMRFIRGESLKDAIAAFHGDARLKTDDGARRLALHALLRRFVDVCNALEYAHSRGVVHRDVKPANVILGKHGETLVVDWGLAKSVDRPEGAAGESFRLPPNAAEGSETVTGTVLGTPAYMSPEQAAGKLEEIGPRSDVYSLGATLYVLLAGRPAFDGPIATVLAKVREGRFPPPRKLDPRIPRALEFVCLHAMAVDPDDRHPSCKAMAGDVERWMADEPVTGYAEPWNDHLARWLRRYRGLALAVAAGLLFVALASVVSSIRIDAERRAAEAARVEATGKETEARLNLEKARKNLRVAQDVVRETFHRIAGSSLAQTPGGAPLRRQLAKAALDYNNKFLSLDPENKDVRWDVADINLTLGRLLTSANQLEQARTHYRRGIELAQELSKSPSHLDSQDGITEGARAQYLGLVGTAFFGAGSIYFTEGRFSEALSSLEEGRRAAAEALRLSEDYTKVSRNADTIARTPGYARTIVRIDALIARISLEEGRFNEALALYEKVADSCAARLESIEPDALAKAAADDPFGSIMRDFEYLQWGRRGRALALQGLGREKEASAILDEAIRDLDGRPWITIDLKSAQAELILARAGVVGDREARRGDLERAEALSRELLAITPENPTYRPLLGQIRNARADLAREEGNSKQAAEIERAVLAEFERLPSGGEGRPTVPLLLVVANAKIGLARSIGESPEAARLRLEASRILDEAASICPKHVDIAAARAALLAPAGR